MFYCDKIRTYVLNLARIEILISCILDKGENIGHYIGVGSDGSHDPPTWEIDMRMILLAVVVLVSVNMANIKVHVKNVGGHKSVYMGRRLELPTSNKNSLNVIFINFTLC